MSIKLKVALPGSFRTLAKDIEDGLGAAVKIGVQASAEGLKLDLRQGLDRAGLPRRVGNMIGSAAYPRRGGSLDAAGTVFARGSSAGAILSTLTRGAVIVPRQGRHLLVPTGYNLAGGRRKAGSRGVRVTPEQMVRSRMSFILPGENGSKLWCLRVSERTTAGKSGTRSKTRAYAGGLAQVGGGRAGRVRKILKVGYVPMFLLLPRVRINRKLDAAALGARWAGRTPELIARAARHTLADS